MIETNFKLSIVIPCFNEEAGIKTTHQRVQSVITQNHYESYELIYVNDGSTDKTAVLLNELSDENNAIKVIHFSRNFGHQAAVTAGLSHTTGDVAIIIDADLQDPPELFPDMIKIWQEESCDVVYGVRTKRRGETLFKKLSATVFYRLLNWLSNSKIPLDTGDFRLVNSKVLQEFKRLKEKNKYIRGLFSWLGFKQCPMYYERDQRHHGTTNYPFMKMIRFGLNGILYFSKKPLNIAIFVGFLSVFIAFCLFVYALYSKYFLSTSVGWASTITVNVFFSGINLLCLGIIGKYVGIILDEVKDRPEYVIDYTSNL